METDTPFARLNQIRLDFFSDLREGQFAEKVGASKQAWSTWKKRRGLAQRAVPQIVEKLRQQKVQVTADWLLLGVGEKPYKGSAKPPHHADAHIARVIELMEATDQNGRMEAFGAVREALREYERSRINLTKKIGA